jgi:hypothetical protein
MVSELQRNMHLVSEKQVAKKVYRMTQNTVKKRSCVIYCMYNIIIMIKL